MGARRRTKTWAISLDEQTFKNLKSLAARRHSGDVSALLKEIASREAKFAAGEEFIASCGFPPLSDAAIARIEAEWRGEKPARTAPRRG
jgi:hypothetical protein